LVQDLRRCPDYGLIPVAFLDDDPRKRVVERLPVLGPLSELRKAVRRTGIDAVVVAIPSLPAVNLRALLDEATSSALHVRFLPSFHAAMESDPRCEDLRNVRIGSLLGRDELLVARPDVRTVMAGRRVLVTGAGGSIGSELCRQVRSLDPESLAMVDHDESNLHRLQLEVSGEALLDTDEIIIADIRDQQRIDQVVASFKPDIIFHAAAHKHLPLLERHPCEGVKSNVWGTQVVAEAALRHGVGHFILISTDKAADPTSVLGATKRLAEVVIQSLAQSTTSFASVRFGNVLGSRGSFLTVLAHQIDQRREVTVTDPDVERYFMTVEEAVGLVLEAACMAEAGETFVLDMGEPVRIVDLVESYSAQMGVPRPTIRFTGLRHGEKLQETLFSASERRLPTAHPKIWATTGIPLPPDLRQRLTALYAAAQDNQPDLVRAHLANLVPGYQTPYPSEIDISAGRQLAHAYADDF
jgi:FlaA1/EpsC-like NDP-sugar epimerase